MMTDSPRAFRLVGVFVAVVSFLALGMAAYSGWRWREHALCQAAYNDAISSRTRILIEVGAGEREAQRRRDDALDATFLDPALRIPGQDRTPADQRRLLALFTEYVEAAKALAVERGEADRARAANPLPPPPSALCEP